MKLVAVSLVPAFRFGGGEKWQLECLQELKCFFDEIIYISASKTLNTAQSIFHTGFRKYNFETENWGSEVLGSEIIEHISVCKIFWIFQYQASDISLELILNAHSNSKVFMTNLGCEPAMFFENYTPQRNHCFLEISQFSAKRTARFVPNVAYVWCGYEYKLEKQIVSKAHRQGFVMVGRLLPHKRPDFLIDAWSKTGQPLHIIGSFQEESFFEKLKKSIGKKPVKIYSDISNFKRDNIISKSIGLIAPSSSEPEQSELLGLVIFEALQNGTLPIVSSIPSYIEIMKALGQMDWVFECDSVASLRNVCSSLEELSIQDYCSLVESARTKARNQFKWDNIVPLMTKNENFSY